MLGRARALGRKESTPQIPLALICSSFLAALAYAQSVAAEARLIDLPQYKPQQIVAGTIRNFGFGLGTAAFLAFLCEATRSSPGIGSIANRAFPSFRRGAGRPAGFLRRRL